LKEKKIEENEMRQENHIFSYVARVAWSSWCTYIPIATEKPLKMCSVRLKCCCLPIRIVFNNYCGV